MYRLIAPLTLFCLAPQSLQRVKSTPPRARVFGKIVGEDGRGIAPSRVFLVSWPLRHSSVGSVDRIEVTTRQLGRFEARLLEGRAYTVWGQIKDEKGTSMTNVIEAATAGRPLRLIRASRWQRPRGQVTGRELWASATLELCVVASTRNVVEAKLTLSKEGIAIIPPMPGRRGYLTIRNKDGLHVALKSVDFSNGKTVVVNLAKPLLVDLMVTSKATGKPPRQQYLLVGAPGHAATYVFFGGPDRKRDLRVALDSGSSLSGRVLRPDGKAATGAQLLIVTMVRAAGNPGGHWGVPPIPVTCGKDGRFEFHGLTRRNNFHVLALTPGLGLSKQMTNPVHWLLAHAPATDEKTDLGDLELARLSKLELRVQHADGSPATAARVHQHDRRLSVWIDHVVDSRGKLSMLCPATELAFGAYELRGGVGLARWTLGQGAQTRVLRLSQPVTVFGTVVAATGEPVAGAWVRLWNRPIGPSFALKGLCFKQQDYQVKTDVKGEFQLEAAGVEGDYRLRAGSSSKGKWTISAEIPFTIDPQRPRVPQLEVKLPEPSATDPSNK